MKNIALRAARRLALVSVALAASPAFAQDQIKFDGFRVGALLGLDSVSLGGDGTSRSVEGFAYYIELGRDFQIGKLVLGIGSEYGGSTVSEGITDGTTAEKLETGVDFYIGPRIGYVVGKRTMIYAKGGYTRNKTKLEVEDTNGTIVKVDPSIDGFRVGLGVEHMLSSRFYIKGEARYSKYSNVEITDANGTEVDIGVDLDRFQVLFGVGVRF